MTRESIAIFSGALLLASVARADIDSDLVRAGLEAYEQLDFPHAVDLLERAAAQSLTGEELRAACFGLAMSHLALGHRDEARGVLERLLSIDESFTPPPGTLSPLLREVLDAAREHLADRDSVLPLVHPDLSPPHPRESEALTLNVAYPGGIADRLQLFHRARREREFSKTVALAAPGGRFEVVLSGSDLLTPGIDYFLVVLDERGVPVAGAGTASRPLTLNVSPSAARPANRRWVGGLVGGTLAGAAVVAAGIVLHFVLATRPGVVTILPE